MNNLHRVLIFGAAFSALMLGSAYIGGNDAITSNVPTVEAVSFGATSRTELFTPKLDQIEPGYYDVTGFLYDGISEAKLNPAILRPTFSFTIGRVAYGNVEPTGVMPVSGDGKPRVLVQRRSDGHNSVVVVLPASHTAIAEIKEAAPHLILTGQEES